MMKADKFTLEGSPLDGRVVPTDWKLLDHQGKKARLVALRWAPDLYEAGRMLAKHSAASRGRKHEREKYHRTHEGARWWDN